MGTTAAIVPALVHGAWLCGWMALVIVGSLRHDPRIWQGDAPRALQEQLGPIPAATQRRKRGWGVVMLVGLVGITAHLVHEVAGQPGAGWLGFMVAAYVMFEVFNLFDALVIDVGLLLVWAPDWAFAPGTKGHPSLRDWRYHVRGYLVGVVGGVPFAAIVASIAALWP